jgi:hypothetical protein
MYTSNELVNMLSIDPRTGEQGWNPGGMVGGALNPLNPGDTVAEKIGYGIANRRARRANRRANIAKGLGLDDTQKFFEQNRDRYRGWEPGKIIKNSAGMIKDNLGLGNGGIIDKGLDYIGPGGTFTTERGKEFLKPVQDEFDLMKKKRNDYFSSNNDYMADIKENGPYGARYAGTETGALNKLGAAGDVKQTGADVKSLLGDISGSRGDLDKAYENSLMGTLSGENLSPNSQWYQAQSALFDDATKDALEQARGQAGARRGLGSGQYNKTVADITNKGNLQKNAALAGIQKEQLASINPYLASLRGDETQKLGIAADLQKNAAGLGVRGAEGQLSHINNAGNLGLGQAKLRTEIDDKRYGVDKDMLENVRDQKEWEFEADLAKKNNMMNQAQAGLNLAQDFGSNGLFGRRANRNMASRGLGDAAKMFMQFGT